MCVPPTLPSFSAHLFLPTSLSQEKMKLRLTVSGGPDDGFQFLLTNSPLTIGRGTDVLWTIHDRWLSRRHCELTLENDAAVLRDLGSKHGTWVNHVPIREMELQEGDHVTIGSTTLVVQLLNDAEEPLNHEFSMRADYS